MYNRIGVPSIEKRAIHSRHNNSSASAIVVDGRVLARPSCNNKRPAAAFHPQRPLRLGHLDPLSIASAFSTEA